MFEKYQRFIVWDITDSTSKYENEICANVYFEIVFHLYYNGGILFYHHTIIIEDIVSPLNSSSVISCVEEQRLYLSVCY